MAKKKYRDPQRFPQINEPIETSVKRGFKKALVVSMGLIKSKAWMSPEKNHNS